MRKLAVVLRICTYIAFCTLLFGMSNAVDAQPGPSFSVSYDFFPYQKFDDPDSAALEGVEVQVTALNLEASYPLVFSQGRTVLVNQIFYQLREIDYRNWGAELGEEPHLKRLHAVKYTLTLRHVLSQKWYLLTLTTPGLASDFEADITGDDFTYEAAVVFVRQFSERWALGFGAAYSNQFGEPLPLPVLAFEWNNGSNLRANGIVPVNLEFWYLPRPNLELGLVLKADGNRYHGDPDIYGVDNPLGIYSALTVGPSARIHLSKAMHLNVEGGFIPFHRFEFYDGDKEASDYSLRPGAYLRAGIQIGG